MRHCWSLQWLCVNAVRVAHSPQTLPAGSRFAQGSGAAHTLISLSTPQPQSGLALVLSAQGWVAEQCSPVRGSSSCPPRRNDFFFFLLGLPFLPTSLAALSLPLRHLPGCLPSAFSLILSSSGGCSKLCSLHRSHTVCSSCLRLLAFCKILFFLLSKRYCNESSCIVASGSFPSSHFRPLLHLPLLGWA